MNIAMKKCEQFLELFLVKYKLINYINKYKYTNINTNTIIQISFAPLFQKWNKYTNTIIQIQLYKLVSLHLS